MNRCLSVFAVGFAIALAAIPEISQAGTSTEQSNQIATVPAFDHKIEVSTTCLAGTAIFRVTNLGEKLPTLFSFNLIRINSNTVVSKRRLRLASGQNVTFKLKNADKIPSHIGLLVNAKDYQRDGQMLALVRCEASST